ncbi:MAG TPA: hypothetical protein VHI13_13575 [Candidatus Kapabacteria bacterium]|nr:hypothetical protein [Candidatus Kapabacteria bacterium]
MKFTTSILLLAGLLIAPKCVCARGEKIPLPPTFQSGNAGAWLGSGPLFGFDTPLGNDFGGGWGGSGGGAIGSSWDPIGGNGSGGTGNGYPCPGDCWKPVPVGPCTPMCDCYTSDQQIGVTECIKVSDPFFGASSDCKNEFGLGCVIP